MKILIAALFAGTVLLAPPSLFAMDSMHGSMMMPKCAVGDPVVGVNMMSKMYMTHAQMKAQMTGMSDAKIHQMMIDHHVKLMCKSKAEMMGAKMMKPAM